LFGPDGPFLRTVSRDRANQVNQVELVYYITHPDGRKQRLVHGFPMRYLYRFEAERLRGVCTDRS
jgi:hypothetical protein